ncbi:MAG: hypothetical protein JWQ25_1532 [Daejeonella sp.]|nr:hypothetical protein [Daejeonella sp.]
MADLTTNTETDVHSREVENPYIYESESNKLNDSIDIAVPESTDKPWKGYEKVSFRIAFIFFFLLTVPLDIDFYTGWFTTDWSHLHIRDMGKLSGSSFSPIKVVESQPGGADLGSLAEKNLDWLTIRSESGIYGIASYVNWGLAFLIALIGGAIWTAFDKKTKNYRVLYYFLTIMVSYSMLIKLNGLTFSKIFPTQMPDLALTQLNTNLGDFTAQKLYWIQLSFVQGYEVFAGLAELLIILLLFFRKTRAWGAALALAMIGNITVANHVYDGGIHLAAAFYIIGGGFVLWRYLPSIWNLIVNQKDVKPNFYDFPFSKPWQKYGRIAVKSFVFGFFILLSGYLHWYNYKHDSYKVPSKPGLVNSRGFYEVTEFKLNGKSIPYSPVDSVRWQDVTFEKWSTISFSVFNTFMIHGEAGRGKQFKDVDRTYESAGTGGGRRHFYYEADTIDHTLTLFNKNKVYKNQKMVLNYDRPNANEFILSGTNENGKSVYIVLNKTEKKYPLYENGDYGKPIF